MCTCIKPLNCRRGGRAKQWTPAAAEQGMSMEAAKGPLMMDTDTEEQARHIWAVPLGSTSMQPVQMPTQKPYATPYTSSLASHPQQSPQTVFGAQPNKVGNIRRATEMSPTTVDWKVARCYAHRIRVKFRTPNVQNMHITAVRWPKGHRKFCREMISLYYPTSWTATRQTHPVFRSSLLGRIV